MDKIPKRYVPDSLTESQKKKQIASIKKGTDRPKLEGVRTRRSSWTIKAHKYFGDAPSVEDIRDALGLKTITPLKEIIKRGEKAYYTSGSRPNVTPEAWGRARLYAVVFGSEGARKADGDIVKKYNIGVLDEKKGGSKQTDEIVKTKTYPESYGYDATKIIDTMAFDPSNVIILGSMGFRSQHFASDYDCFERVDTNNMDKTADKFQKIVRSLVSIPKTYIMDIKCGDVPEWSVIDETAHILDGVLYGYDAKESREKLKELYDDEIITKQEYDEGNSLLVDSPSVDSLREIIKKLRFNVVRWTANDILKGSLELRDKTKLKLADAMMGKSIFKIDVISLGEDNIYNEFSMIYDLRLKGRRINKGFINVEHEITKDIQYYSSINSWFKVLKRLFSLSAYRYRFKKESPYKDMSDMLLQKLNEILNSDLGLLNQMLSELDVLVLMLEDKQTVSKDVLKSHVNSFIERIGNVYSISEIVRKNEEFFDEFLSTLKLKGDKLGERLDKIHQILKLLLDRETYRVIHEEQLNRYIEMMI